jgi:hypothetical protein
MAILILWIVNLGISIWNAVAAGRAWAETQHAGGTQRIIAWAVAIMSAAGFTWCYLSVLSLLGVSLGFVSDSSANTMLAFGYVIVAPAIVASGVVILLDSWAAAYRRRTLGNVAAAGYNTFAEAYNGYHAVRGLGPAFQQVLGTFRGRDRDGIGLSGILIGFVLVVFFAGILTTWLIIEHVAAAADPRVYQTA